MKYSVEQYVEQMCKYLVALNMPFIENMDVEYIEDEKITSNTYECYLYLKDGRKVRIYTCNSECHGSQDGKNPVCKFNKENIQKRIDSLKIVNEYFDYKEKEYYDEDVPF